MDDDVKRRWHIIGSFVKFQPWVDPEVGAIVESELGDSILRSFLVDNFEDEKTLMELGKQFFQKKNQKPFSAAIKLTFSGELHDVSKDRVKCSKFKSFLEILDIENPEITKMLIEVKFIDKVLFIPKDTDAQELLKNESTVPRNCKFAVTLGRHKYFPAPNYRAIPMSYVMPRPKLIQTNDDLMPPTIVKDLMLENYMEMLKMKAECKGREDALKSLHEDLKRDEFEKAEAEKLVTELIQKNLSIDRQIEQLKNKNDDDTRNETFGEDVERILECASEIEGEELALKKKYEEARDMAEEAQTAYRQQQDALKNQKEKLGTLEEKLGEIETEIQKLDGDKLGYTEKRASYVGRLKDQESELAVKKKNVATATKTANEMNAERVKTRKSTDKLEKEILKSIDQRVQTHFGTRLAAQEFSGQIEIDHDKETLKILISPDGDAADLKK